MPTGTMSVSGVVSGMDWESMISKLLEKAQAPAMVQVNKRTNLQNKKSLFEEMKVTMNSIQSSLSPLKLPSTYKAKDIEIERIDTNGSYKGVLTATVNADAEVNVYDLQVKQLARAQTNRSSQINASTLKNTLGGLESSKLYINAGNQKIGIDVYDTDSLESLKSRINTTLKTLNVPVGITASVVDNRLILKSDSTGLGTTSVTGTAAQRYNTSGYTDLTNIITNADASESVSIYVNDANAENLKVSSGSKSYSIHKDYEIVNNQIRWKQYEDTGSVKLGESVAATYTMGKGDVYTKTAKRGSDDTDSVDFGLDVIDKGTLSQRMKIKGNKTTTSTVTETKDSLDDDEEVGTTTTTETTQDDDGNDVITKTTIKISQSQNDDGDDVYTIETTTAVTQMTEFVYGKDFTYENGKVTWLEQESATCEPDSYTVSIERDDSVNYSVAGGKKSETTETTFTTEPDTYSVKIKTGAKGSYTINSAVTRNVDTNRRDQVTLDFSTLSEKYKEATGEELSLTVMPNVDRPNDRTYDNAYLDIPQNYTSFFNITVGGTEYEYGRDFVIITRDRTTTNTASGNFAIQWGNSASNTASNTSDGIVRTFAQAKGISGSAKNAPSAGTNYSVSFEYDLETNLSGKVAKTDNDKTLETIFGEEVDPQYYSSLTIRGYEYGTDFEVNDEGEIVWIEQTASNTSNTDDDEININVDDFNAAYKKAAGEDVPTLTLTGSDGVIRTYLDPADRSLFKLKDDNGTEYEYGRDYVIRVKDDGDGYILTWFAADDRTGDEIIDANDASVAVATYAGAKNISTLNFKKSPDADTGYTFGFSSEGTKEYSSDNISSSDEDRDLSLEALFGEDLGLSDSDYADIVIKDSAGNSYKYGVDFTVTDGAIEWLPKYDTIITTEIEEQEVTKTNKPAEFTVNYQGTIEDYDTAYTQAMSTSTFTANNDFYITDLLTDETQKGMDYLASLYYDETGETLKTFEYTNASGQVFKIADLYSVDNPIKIDVGGTEYEYGKDFLIRTNAKQSSGSYSTALAVHFVRTGATATGTNGSAYYQAYRDYLKNNGTITDDTELASTNTTAEVKAASTIDFNILTKNDTDVDTTYDSTSDDDNALSSLIALANGDYDNLTITDADGNEYSYVADESLLDDESFTIVNGEIKWNETLTTEEVTVTKTEYVPRTINTPNAPDANSEYTIYYESFAGMEIEATSDGEDEQELKLFNDQGKISDSGTSYLSYEQILRDASSKLSTSSSQSDVDEALEKYFSITDSNGDTYEYGTDFIVKMGDEDLTSGQHKAILEWLSIAPDDGEALTISYTGRGEGGGEVFKVSDAVTRNNSDPVFSGPSGAALYSEFKAGTTTITQGSKTYYEGIDFEISGDEDTNGGVTVNWKTGTDWEWYYPTSGQYDINLTTASGVTKTFTAYRDRLDTFDLRDFGFETVSNNGVLNSITYGGKTYNLTSTSKNDDDKTDSDLVRENLGINLTEGTNGGVRVFDFNWGANTRTNREGMPGIGDEIEIEYEYDTNVFTLSDDGDNLINLLGLNDDVTEAQNAILVLDGEEIERDLNNIGESYGNELIKGMTINLKGIGEVSMDVSHDAEKAVTSIQTFVDNYNSLMSWMNTRMTEKEVDKDTKATIDSDDFRMRWGLLHGNSLLRNTKSQMRDRVAQNYTFSFKERKSTEEIYGAMSYNGLKADSTLRLRINSTYVDVPVLMTDSITDIANKINDNTNPAMRNIHYGEDNQLLGDPLIKAKVEGDKLVIYSPSNAEITMSGTAAMNALKMNYTYKGIYQLGIATTSTDYGKSGELEFDTEKFMDALEDNPDEVQELMLKFANNMDTWTKSMLNTSSSGETSGTLTRQIEDIDTQIKSIDEYLEKYEDRLEKMEDSLRTRYAAAEQQISKLTQQASAISAILQQMTNSGGNNNASA